MRNVVLRLVNVVGGGAVVGNGRGRCVISPTNVACGVLLLGIELAGRLVGQERLLEQLLVHLFAASLDIGAGRNACCHGDLI